LDTVSSTYAVKGRLDAKACELPWARSVVWSAGCGSAH